MHLQMMGEQDVFADIGGRTVGIYRKFSAEGVEAK